MLYGGSLLRALSNNSSVRIIMSFGTSSTQNVDYKVPQPGNDGISSLTWSPANLLVSSNWDSGVRCWEVQEAGGRIQAVPKAQGKL